MLLDTISPTPVPVDARDVRRFERGDPEWDTAPTLAFDLSIPTGCVGPHGYVLKQVRGRFRVVGSR